MLVARDLCDPGAFRILRRARFAYIAVQTRSGPHVTPVLFAATPDRLWFAVARGTLKVRALAKRPRIGALVQAGGQAVLIAGEAVVLDPAHPRPLAGRPGEIARAPLAVPSYALRNVGEMLGFARDARSDLGRAGPQTLVLVSVRPERIEVVGLAAAAREPAANGAGASGAKRSAVAGPLDHADVPAELAELARRQIGRAHV